MKTSTCPQCDLLLVGLATYCPVCDEYVADMGSTTDVSVEKRDATPDDRLEDEIRRAIRKVFELRPGWAVYDLEQNRPTRQTAGLADLYVCGHGHCVWIEVKRSKGKQSEAQEKFEHAVTEAGGFYIVMRHESEAIRFAEEAERRVA